MIEYGFAKLSSVHWTSLGKIQRIFRPRTISNRDLLARSQQEHMETIITRKRWRWIGHVLRKDANSITNHHSTEGNLAKNCGSGSEDHEPLLGHHPETGQ